eukprot:1153555-Prymnesium_polylepis.1
MRVHSSKVEIAEVGAPTVGAPAPAPAIFAQILLAPVEGRAEGPMPSGWCRWGHGRGRSPARRAVRAARDARNHALEVHGAGDPTHVVEVEVHRGPDRGVREGALCVAPANKGVNQQTPGWRWIARVRRVIPEALRSRVSSTNQFLHMATSGRGTGSQPWAEKSEFWTVVAAKKKAFSFFVVG